MCLKAEELKIEGQKIPPQLVVSAATASYVLFMDLCGDCCDAAQVSTRLLSQL